MDTSDWGDANYSQMLQAHHLNKQKPKVMSKVYFNHTTKLSVVKQGYVPAATIALTKVGNQFHYGVAICSRYDNFSKKYGREVATARLEQNFGVLDVPKPMEGLTEKEQCLNMLYSLAASVVIKNKKWKKRVTKFNMAQKLPGAKVIQMDTNTPAA